MEIFFRQLALQLDMERPNWRADTVVLLDNASYHASTATQRIFQELQMPVMYTGVYAYDMAPVELFFSYLKRSDLNPGKLPLGKK